MGQAEAQRLLGVPDNKDLLASSMLRDVAHAFDRNAFETQLTRALLTGDFDTLKTQLDERRQLIESKAEGLLAQVNDAVLSGRLGPEVAGPMKKLISGAVEAAEQRFAEFADATLIAAEDIRKSSSEAQQAELEAQARQRLGVPENADLLTSALLDHVAVHLDADRFRSELIEAKQTSSYTDLGRWMKQRKDALGDHQKMHLNRIERNVRDGKLAPELGAEMSKLVQTVFDAAHTHIESFDQKIDQTTKEQLAALLSVSPDASHADLTKAKRRASLQFHPDKNRDNPEAATQKISVINVAWDNYNARFLRSSG